MSVSALLQDQAEITSLEFREAMRQLAGGVSVVTSGLGHQRTGFTATSVTSLSTEPPSILVCINKQSSSLLTIRQTGSFAVNILNRTHDAVAERFSGRSGVFGAARFQDAEWDQLSTGAPALDGALANLDCQLENMTEWSSHTIVIGRVVAIRTLSGENPLVYWQGQYKGL